MREVSYVLLLALLLLAVKAQDPRCTAQTMAGFTPADFHSQPQNVSGFFSQVFYFFFIKT